MPDSAVNLPSSDVEFLAEDLYRALRDVECRDPLSERFPQMTIADAYAISQRFLEHRLKDGESLVGKKIGVTSAAVQEMLGVYQPDFGFLTDAMDRSSQGAIRIHGELIAPRIEAEIGFWLREDLIGPGVRESDVLAATERIVPCFEIVDSRIRDWRIRIQDTIADNASCGVFVVGETYADPRDLDLPQLRITVDKNGEQVAEGFGSAVQGNPLTSVAWLANTFGELGMSLNAGELILSGSVTPLMPVAAGDVFTMALHGIGTCAATFR